MRFGPLVLVLAIPPSVSAFEEYCDSLGEGPDFMLEGYLYGWNCTTKRDQVHDVAIYNPYKALISVYSTDGYDCEAAPWPSGGPFTPFESYAKYTVYNTYDLWVNMTAAPCGASPCCVIVQCKDPNILCGAKNYGRFYSAPTKSLSAASIAGLVVGLVFLFVVLPVILAFGWKRYKQLRLANLARGAPQQQANPVVFVISAPATATAVGTKWG